MLGLRWWLINISHNVHVYFILTLSMMESEERRPEVEISCIYFPSSPTFMATIHRRLYVLFRIAPFWTQSLKLKGFSAKALLHARHYSTLSIIGKRWTRKQYTVCCVFLYLPRCPTVNPGCSKFYQVFTTPKIMADRNCSARLINTDARHSCESNETRRWRDTSKLLGSLSSALVWGRNT